MNNIFVKNNYFQKFNEKSDTVLIYIFAYVSKVWLKRRQLGSSCCDSAVYKPN